MLNASCTSILFATLFIKAADFRITNANKNEGSGYTFLGSYFVSVDLMRINLDKIVNLNLVDRKTGKE